MNSVLLMRTAVHFHGRLPVTTAKRAAKPRIKRPVGPRHFLQGISDRHADDREMAFVNLQIAC
jgi:hypothetical protein